MQAVPQTALASRPRAGVISLAYTVLARVKDLLVK